MENKISQYNIVLDLGHGGLDSNGEYTTKPNKMYRHNDGTFAYEGVLNREIGKKVYNYLEELNACPSYTVFPDDPTDIPLKKRCELINNFDPKKTFAVSIHCNASPSHKARGSEIFTSPGETLSDILATYVGVDIQDEFPNLKFRTDYTDGDLDKEAKFYILMNTKCPCILIEVLFFDNIHDIKLLRSETFQKRYAWRIATGIVRFLKTIS